jgi:3-deoxy-D-manno-octulosonate 8-phosphate phosphatase (KDO 8-P phosphatase)
LSADSAAATAAIAAKAAMAAMAAAESMPAAAMPAEELAARAGGLAWLLFDVDGVLTDGRLIYGADGEQWKVFDARDGLGLKLAQRDGLKVGLLSGRESRALETRAQELGVDALVMNRSDKHAAFGEFLGAQATTAARVAYLGDDLVDLPVLLACGLSFAPADAVPDVRRRVHHVLSRPGGRAAAREMVEVVLRARGAWDRLIAGFLRPAAGAGPPAPEGGPGAAARPAKPDPAGST